MGSHLPTAAPPTDRLEMLPQPLEKIESAPGNGAALNASDEAARLAAPAQDPADPPPADRPEMAPQSLENIESAPGNGAAWHSSDAAFASREAPAQNPLAPGAPLMRRIEIATQAIEIAQRNDLDATPPAAPAAFSPTVGNLSGVRRPNVRAILNGVMAC